MPVTFKYPKKGFLELLVRERVAEWIDRAVEVAQPVGDVVEKAKAAAVGQRTEPDDEGQDVPRSPAENERSEDDGDGSQRLPGAVLALAAGRRRFGLRLARLAAAVARCPLAGSTRPARLRRAPARAAPHRRPGLTASAPVTARCRLRHVRLQVLPAADERRQDRLHPLLLNADN